MTKLYPEKPCTECGKPSLGRNLCPTHYNVQWKIENAERFTHTCAHCGEEFKTWRKIMATCSLLCQRRNAIKTAQPLAVAHIQANAKYAEHIPVPEATKAERWRASRGPLRAAYEDKQWSALLALVEGLATKTPDGCWEWAGVITNGYPRHSGLKGLAGGVHRAVLEAKHERPLGKQAAHHVCANSICVNPDHLQPVTHRENTAEMLARNYYITRIKQLEQALSATNPRHALLQEVGVA